jgi:hypothetical protein
MTRHQPYTFECTLKQKHYSGAAQPVAPRTWTTAPRRGPRAARRRHARRRHARPGRPRAARGAALAHRGGRITRYGRWAPPARPSACEGRHPAGVRFCFNVHDSGHARALAAIPRDELPRSRRVLHNAPPPARDTARGAPSGARGLAHRSQATRGPRHTHGQHLAYTYAATSATAASSIP